MTPRTVQEDMMLPFETRNHVAHEGYTMYSTKRSAGARMTKAGQLPPRSLGLMSHFAFLCSGGVWIPVAFLFPDVRTLPVASLTTRRLRKRRPA